MDIALFGTSADPPTIAHLAILHHLRDRFDRVAVWASENPFKHHHYPLDQRMDLLRGLLRDLTPGADTVAVHEDISDRRSVHTVEKARQKWGRSPRYHLVIGADLIEQIPTWYAIAELLNLVHLAIIPRAGYRITDERLQPLQALQARWQILEIHPPAAASSGFRESGDHQLLSPTVQRLVVEQRLYGKA